MRYLYLSGPIAGVSYQEATDWRRRVEQTIFDARIDLQAISPMRYKNHLAVLEKMPHTYDHHLSTSKGLTTRDRWDVMRCDAMLVNVLGAERVSIGTMIEVGWADALRKPIITVMEKGNIHDHPILRECSGYIVDNIFDGLTIVRGLFG